MRPAVSRRPVFGASAALLLIGAGEAGAAKAAELDSDLLVACVDFAKAERRVKASEGLTDVSNADWARLIDGPGIAWQQAVARLSACPPARTPEAIQARSQAALVALRRLHPSAEDAPVEVALALACLADVAGRKGA